MNFKPALTIDDLVEIGPFGRSKIFNEIRSGRLPARKAGNRTVILREEFENYLRDLPMVEARTREIPIANVEGKK